MKNLINYLAGMTLGVISTYMLEYSEFLYYTVFTIQAIIIYILINFSIPYKFKKPKLVK